MLFVCELHISSIFIANFAGFCFFSLLCIGGFHNYCTFSVYMNQGRDTEEFNCFCLEYIINWFVYFASVKTWFFILIRKTGSRKWMFPPVYVSLYWLPFFGRKEKLLPSGLVGWYKYNFLISPVHKLYQKLSKILGYRYRSQQVHKLFFGNGLKKFMLVNNLVTSSLLILCRCEKWRL